MNTKLYLEKPNKIIFYPNFTDHILFERMCSAGHGIPCLLLIPEVRYHIDFCTSMILV
jgi:hypothetical protein